MNVYTCEDHDQRWPVGQNTVVVARDEEEAREYLDNALVAYGLKPFGSKPYTLKLVDLTKPSVPLFGSGEY